MPLLLTYSTISHSNHLGSMNEEQKSLFGPVEVVERRIHIDEVRPPSLDGASNNVSASIRSLGNISTPLLREIDDSEYDYAVVDGKRRVESYGEQGIDAFLALVVPLGSNASNAQIAAMRLVRNQSRSPNPLQEAMACQRILDEGGTEGAISKELGIPIQTVRKRLRLASAPSVILEGVREGDIAITTASRLSNMRDDLKKRAIEEYEEKGTLTGADLKSLSKARTQSLVSAAQSQSTEMFDASVPPPAESDDTAEEDAPEPDPDPMETFRTAARMLLQGDHTFTSLRTTLREIKNDLAEEGKYQ